MIEVEIRGELSKEKFDELNNFFPEKGKLLEVQDREMILIHDTPLYNADPTLRQVDIRIRTTNGERELMVKEMKSEGNTARSEHQYIFSNADMEGVKKLVKFFGYNSGGWMHRKKSVYDHNFFNWSLVEAVPGIYYYELEKEVSEDADFEKVKQGLIEEAKSHGLTYMSDEEHRIFIKMLTATVNKYITW
jgi:adenylate cyclase class IV